MFQTAYNDSDLGQGTPLDMVFFEDAVVHLARISRVLHMSHCHMVLVGGAACGKSSLTRLASFIAGNKIVEISLTR